MARQAQFNIRIDSDLKRRMEAAAKERGLNLSSWLKMIAIDEMDSRGIETPPEPDHEPKAVGKNMNTHPEEIINTVRSLRDSGLSAAAIANHLNDGGYLSATMKPFNKGAVEGIIRRKV
jgi:hypothetical protein